MTEGLQAVEFRQIFPTLAGIPLDLHARASVVAKVDAHIKTNLKPGLFTLLGLKEATATINANPR